MNQKKLSFILLFSLIVPGVHAEAVIHQQNRLVRVHAQSPEGNENYPFDFGFPVETYDSTMTAFTDAYGGPGIASASATTTQNSTISPSLFSGSFSVAVGAFSTQDYLPLDYYAFAEATSGLFVQFELVTPHNYSLSGSGLGDTSFFLRDEGGSYILSESGFGVLQESGQLLPGLYDLRFAVHADATALGWQTQTFISDSGVASGNFAFRLVSVPDTSSSLMLLSLTAPLLLVRRRRMCS